MRGAAILLAAFALAVSACASYPSTPEGIVAAQRRALESGDYEKFLSFLTDSDLSTRGSKYGPMEYWDGIFEDMSYETRYDEFRVISSVVNGQTALVTVGITSPDVRELMKEIRAEFKAMTPEEQEKALPNDPDDYLSPRFRYETIKMRVALEDKNRKFEPYESTETVNLKFEGGKWKVFWDAERSEGLKRQIDEAFQYFLDTKDMDGAFRMLDKVEEKYGPDVFITGKRKFITTLDGIFKEEAEEMRRRGWTNAPAK